MTEVDDDIKSVSQAPKFRRCLTWGKLSSKCITEICFKCGRGPLRRLAKDCNITVLGATIRDDDGVGSPTS
jgi:hypothetical protein